MIDDGRWEREKIEFGMFSPAITMAGVLMEKRVKWRIWRTVSR